MQLPHLQERYSVRPSGLFLWAVRWFMVQLSGQPNSVRMATASLVRLRVRTNNGVEVPVGQKHWLSVAEGNCVAERRGGEQPEANNQSIIKKMMNSIRPDALASLLGKGEAQNGSRPGKGQWQFRDLDCGEHSERRTGVHGVGGDRMVGSWSDMNQGSLFGKGTAFMTGRGSEEPYPKGDRAF